MPKGKRRDATGARKTSFATEDDKDYFAPSRQADLPNLFEFTHTREGVTGEWLQDIARRIQATYGVTDGKHTIQYPKEPIIDETLLCQLLNVGTALLAQLPNIVPVHVPVCDMAQIPPQVLKTARKLEPLSQTELRQLSSCPNEKLVIVGDIHGSYDALNAILTQEGLPSDGVHYVFNGDLVDRGAFGVETFLTVLGLFICWPSRVTIVRGNHECLGMALVSELAVEIEHKYGKRDAILAKFIACFRMLPIGALINGRYLVVHGGIPARRDVSLEMLNRLNRRREPLIRLPSGAPCPKDMVGIKLVPSIEHCDPLNDVLWADPCEGARDVFNAVRGISYCYCPSTITGFMQRERLSYIIRSHECVPGGFRVDKNSGLITVFSVPNYEEPDNAAYLVLYSGDGLLIAETLDAPEKLVMNGKTRGDAKDFLCGRDITNYAASADDPLIVVHPFSCPERANVFPWPTK